MTHECPTGYHVVPSRTCYTQHSCRCSGCRRAQAEYAAALAAILKRRNPRSFVDATPTAVRLRWLVDNGASLRWVSTQAGLAKSTLPYVTRGERRYVTRATAHAVERVARDVAAGRLHPPWESEAVDRRLLREQWCERKRDSRARRRAA